MFGIRFGAPLMCLGYPAKVIELDCTAAAAIVDDRGRRRHASTLLIDRVAIGDWVLVAAGNVIRRLAPDDAAALATDIAVAERSTKPAALSPDTSSAFPTDLRPQGDTP